MWICNEWKDYEILDISSGDKLEVWNGYKLIRPDPQVIWDERQFPALWKDAHARYKRSNKGGGNWEFNKKLPDEWEVSFEPLGLKFMIKPMGFKHTGLFPEQAANWMWFSDIIKNAVKKRPVRVLNLFAYTGGATAAAAAAGADVVHVDSSKGMVSWAKENLALSGHGDKFVRFIVDDAIKFTEREIRRGSRYDGIIMDPPSYGRGPTGEVWKIEENIDDFVSLTEKVLSDNPLFFLLNSYTTGLSASTMKYIAETRLLSDRRGISEADELGLLVRESGLALPCGSSVRITFKK